MLYIGEGSTRLYENGEPKELKSFHVAGDVKNHNKTLKFVHPTVFYDREEAEKLKNKLKVVTPEFNLIKVVAS